MNRLVIKGLLTLFIFFLSFHCFSQKDSTAKKPVGDKNGENFPASIKVAANPKLKGNAFKKFFLGKNYRKEWITPIEVPVINFKTDYGGLTPKKEGGGKETRSLQVEDTSGQVWSLRSVKKYPEKALPPEFHKTIAEKILSDGISASYPYGAVSMSILSRAANVPFLKDELVYIPDASELGKFQSKFKNSLVLMEDKEPEGFATKQKDEEDQKSVSTGEVVYALAKKNTNKVDQLAVLRARLLDNFVMDFDRHEGQWNWIAKKSEDGKTFYPIPKDRDQVFYTNQGILPKFIRGKTILPELQGFEKKAKNIRTFNRPARNFDRFFLTELSEDDWSREIDVFLGSMTDEVIESALKKQPKEIQKYSVKKIIRTLKEKRKYFKDDMMKYYNFIASKVAIVGSNEREQFTISKNDNESVSVVANKIDSAGNISTKLYERTFDPNVTSDIQIYGLEGDDKFVVQGERSKIKIRLIGGPGNDQFINNSRGSKILAYDVKFEENAISGKRKIRNRITNDPLNNTFTRLGYHYTSFISPGISVEYSVDGGLFLGPKLKITTQGFRKDPYSMLHKFSANRSINSSSYHLKYSGDFIRVFKKTDLLIRGDLKLPTSRTHFFGLGNNTVLDKTKPGGHQYYLARYNLSDISALFRTPLGHWVQIKYGPIFQYFRLSGPENADKYITQLNLNYPDPKTLYVKKFYSGAEFRFEINTKNNQIIPTRGVTASIFARSLLGLNSYSNNIGQAGADLSLYTNFISKKHVVLATSFGVSHNIGNFEFEQAQYLGFKQNLRGFRIERFAGRTRAYNNAEIRIKIADINAYLFPAGFGILAFNDVGRVWTDNETSSTWHNGYGGGIWIAPLNKIVITGSMTYSKEEKNLGLVTFGFQF
jgi:hypothetical protein